MFFGGELNAKNNYKAIEVNNNWWNVQLIF
jgi:hypothetical protein